MGQYLTTADDFQIFQEAVAHWQKRLGLLDCHIYTRHKNRHLKITFPAEFVLSF